MSVEKVIAAAEEYADAFAEEETCERGRQDAETSLLQLEMNHEWAMARLTTARAALLEAAREM